MKAERRSAINEVVGELEKAVTKLEELKYLEQKDLDALPEDMEFSDEESELEDAIDDLSYAIEDLQTAIESIKKVK